MPFVAELFEPASDEEVRDALLSHGPVAIRGLGTKDLFGCPVESDREISTLGIKGIVEWSPEDLVVVVRAGTPVTELQSELASKGQCIPIPSASDAATEFTAGKPGTVGGLVSANLPTRWDSVSRGVRYWVLGVRAVLADGRIARAGSKAVKNVAGYDSQKLFIGAWGTMGVLTDVIFRTFPIARFSGEPECIERIGDWSPGRRPVIARVPRVSLAGASLRLNSGGVVDHSEGTLWTDYSKKLQSYVEKSGGWILCAGMGRSNFPIHGPQTDLMCALKQRIDPHRKINPGRLGVF